MRSTAHNQVEMPLVTGKDCAAIEITIRDKLAKHLAHLGSHSRRRRRPERQGNMAIIVYPPGEMQFDA